MGTVISLTIEPWAQWYPGEKISYSMVLQVCVLVILLAIQYCSSLPVDSVEILAHAPVAMLILVKHQACTALFKFDH